MMVDKVRRLKTIWLWIWAVSIGVYNVIMLYVSVQPSNVQNACSLLTPPPPPPQFEPYGPLLLIHQYDYSNLAEGKHELESAGEK